MEALIDGPVDLLPRHADPHIDAFAVNESQGLDGVDAYHPVLTREFGKAFAAGGENGL